MTGNQTFDSTLWITLVEVHCRKLFAEFNQACLLYHNIGHTELVVQRCKEIAEHYPLSEIELFTLLAAAWFHDTGHLVHVAKNHEMKSVELMSDFFSGLSIDAELVNQIAYCILATKLPAKPQSLMEMILCDADLYHLGTPEFLACNETVKQETESRLGISVSNWNETSLAFLKNHAYFTKYCRQKLSAGKAHNIQQLKQLVNRR